MHIASIRSFEFYDEEGMMEVGIGHHGEPGIEVCKIETAEQMAKNGRYSGF